MDPITLRVPVRGDKSWTEWCITMSAFIEGMSQEMRGREMAGRVSEMTMRQIDWLAVAIGNLGGPRPAARKLSVSPQTVYNWLNDGLSGVEFVKVALLSKKGDVPLEYLARRMDRWNGSGDVEQ